MSGELDLLNARREPARAAILSRKAAAEEAGVEGARAAELLANESEAYESANREIEGLEADVEAARSEVFSAINAATALRHSLEHAGAASERVAESLSKLQVETDDVRIESERVAADYEMASDALSDAREAIETTRVARVKHEAELSIARTEHEHRARSVRIHEQEIAGLAARLKSLEELEAARAEYGDAARTILAEANGRVGQRGALADYLEVEAGFERAVETYLGDLLQYIIVEQPEHAVAGLELVREQSAGRCGFLVASGGVEAAAGDGAAGKALSSDAAPHGLRPLSSVVRINGPFAAAIQTSIGDAWIADSYADAAEGSRVTPVPITTLSGELFRGAHLVSGGIPREARGILETKRAIRDLRDRIDSEREQLTRLNDEAASFEADIEQATGRIAALHDEHHRQEKAIVGYDAQVRRANDEKARLEQKRQQLSRERRQFEDERELLNRRQEEARSSIVQIELDQRAAEEGLTSAQRRLFEARESVQDLARRAADAGASHAALVERASAVAAEVVRLEEASAELESRSSQLGSELDAMRQRVARLHTAIVESQTSLERDMVVLETLRSELHLADEVAATLRSRSESLDADIRTARAGLEAVRSTVGELDVARATAESDLAHLAQSCLDAVQASLDEVLAEVEALEASGGLVADVSVLATDEGDEVGDEMDDAAGSEAFGAQPTAGSEGDQDLSQPGAAVIEAQQRTLSAEEAIARLRAKIDRLGPVNMMAIEQFDELESRHSFLTTQRKDLIDAIAQTSEAIKRIDETTRQRFTEAFAAINHYFQDIFSTLFGGGRAGLTLLDENDVLESGIEIIAQPPGKRLQSVQLLSGGEKALTAISLMFALFKFKPSPFCLLDEIDAPLDDANIGRFVEMLRGMQAHTQFILITHNRKTMEIADRLYGVTMEEPGVSKLISVQFN
jgi:chromosome segregation protein